MSSEELERKQHKEEKKAAKKEEKAAKKLEKAQKEAEKAEGHRQKAQGHQDKRAAEATGDKEMAIRAEGQIAEGKSRAERASS